MIRFRRFVMALVLMVHVACLMSARAQEPSSQRTPEQRQSYRTAMEAADQQIADEVKAHSELMKNLEYLTTQIGARLTGSTQMQQASEWSLKQFQTYGLDAHLESTTIDHSWTRGAETAAITNPIQKSIGIRAFGWSKSTDGDVSGKVIALEVSEPADFDKYRGKLKGAIVLVNKPADLSKAEANPENAYDAVIPQQHGLKPAGMTWRQRADLMRQIAEEHPAIDSDGQWQARQPFQYDGRASGVQTERRADGFRDA